MDSRIQTKNPNLLPRRNPALDTARIATDPDVDVQELEAMNRLRKIETRTQVVPSRETRRNPSVVPSDDNVAVSEVTVSLIESDSATRKYNAASTPLIDDRKVKDDPILEMKRERNKSAPPKPIFSHSLESKRNEGEVQGHTGASLPVRGFGRHESKVPPTTGVSSGKSCEEVQKHAGASTLVKAFGRHESKVPPNTAPQPNNSESHIVEKHIGYSLPVKAFSRHESKVPNSFVAMGEGRQGDRLSIIPPSTMNRHEMSDTDGDGILPNSPNSHSLNAETLPLDANQESVIPTSAKLPKLRKGFSLLPRAFRAKGKSADRSKDTSVQRMYSLHTPSLPSFRRKPANLTASQ